MTVKQSALAREFLEDHRHLTRGFTDLIDALNRNDLPEACRIADDLDRLAGPHIEFEETVYYPALRRAIGDENVEQLYHEHQLGLEAVETLIQRDPNQPLTEAEIKRLLDHAQTALEHAVSCGTLLGYVTVLEDSEQNAMLEQLEAARQSGRRWTDLPRTHK